MATYYDLEKKIKNDIESKVSSDFIKDVVNDIRDFIGCTDVSIMQLDGRIVKTVSSTIRSRDEQSFLCESLAQAIRFSNNTSMVRHSAYRDNIHAIKTSQLYALGSVYGYLILEDENPRELPEIDNDLKMMIALALSGYGHISKKDHELSGLPQRMAFLDDFKDFVGNIVFISLKNPCEVIQKTSIDAYKKTIRILVATLNNILDRNIYNFDYDTYVFVDDETETLELLSDMEEIVDKLKRNYPLYDISIVIAPTEQYSIYDICNRAYSEVVTCEPGCVEIFRFDGLGFEDMRKEEDMRGEQKGTITQTNIT